MKNTPKKKAGKPTFYTEPMKRINVMLDPETVEFYTKHGRGNLSHGLRNFWRTITRKDKDAIHP